MKLALVGALLLAVSCHSASLRHAQQKKGCAGKAEPDCDKHSKDKVIPPCMANSEIIPGVDCGHVSEVIPKFQKSTLVGKLQGEATNQIADADAAAKSAEDAAKAAKDAAKLADDVG